MAEPTTLPNDKYLNRQFAERFINEWIVRALPFMDQIPRVQTDAETIVATKESYGLYDNPKVSRPAAIMPGTMFKDIEITQFEQTQATIAGRGFQIKIRDRARIFAYGVDEIMRAYQAIVYFASRDMADEMGTTLCASVRQSATGQIFYDWVNGVGHETWGEDGGDPLRDLVKFKATLNFKDMPYVMTDAFIGTTNFNELLETLIFLQTQTDQQKAAFWQEQDATIRTVTLPIIGLRVSELIDGIAEGYMLGLDANNPPCTMYYTSNPLYPAETKRENGLHVYTKDDRDNGWYLIRVWFETAFLTKAQSAGLYGAGI
jgi:hypothetical protein